MKCTHLIITGLVFLSIAVRPAAQPSAGGGQAKSLYKATYTIPPAAMTYQEYCDRLMEIHDTLNIYHEAMFNDFKTAYAAKPRTWGIIAKYRKYTQDYCEFNLFYLYKLPQVGDAKKFESSLSDVVTDNWDMAGICQEFENLKPETSENVLAEIFERLVAKKNKWEIDLAVFYANRDLYKYKYGLK